MCMGLTAVQLASETDFNLIFYTICEMYLISVVCTVFKYFIDLLLTGSGQNESFKNFD